jgi:Pentatricopeptide repeat domain
MKMLRSCVLGIDPIRRGNNEITCMNRSMGRKRKRIELNSSKAAPVFSLVVIVCFSSFLLVTAFLAPSNPLQRWRTCSFRFNKHRSVKLHVTTATANHSTAFETSPREATTNGSTFATVQYAPAAAAHYYPPSTRKVTSRKTQLRWITQTVQKIQGRHSQFSYADRISDDPSVASQLLLDALEVLSTARTQAQVLDAGRLLESVNVASTQPIAIQERVVKAAAMTGLLQLAFSITEHMVHVSGHLPSPICQDAMANALRRVGRVQRLEDLLRQFGSVARSLNKSTSLIAFNTYLAALCDIVTEKDGAVQQQRGGGEFSNNMGDVDVSLVMANYKNKAFDQAWYWIEDQNRTLQCMAITPDSVSYATVLQAAAFVGNQTVIDAIWGELKVRKIQPNIVAYNARLRSTKVNSGNMIARSKNLSRPGRHKKRDQEILKVWDTEISKDPGVSPDKFSIDLLLLPLIRSGRVGDVESLLDGFIKRNSETVVSNAFTAFLLTVVAGGELATARALFEMYILPTLSPVMVGDAGGMIRIVRPTTRHFNVLIEGYRKQLTIESSEQPKNENAVQHDAAREAWSLYRLMLRSHSARPDSYTVTSMMGLCTKSLELSQLLYEAITELGIECSSVVLRAACKSLPVRL